MTKSIYVYNWFRDSLFRKLRDYSWPTISPKILGRIDCTMFGIYLPICYVLVLIIGDYLTNGENFFRNMHDRGRTCRWWQRGSFKRVLKRRPSLTIRPTSRRSFSRLFRMSLISALARASAARSSGLKDRRSDATVLIKSCSFEQCLKRYVGNYRR